MNIEQIESIEEVLQEERKKIELSERSIYENGDHVKHEIGDWVTNGIVIGVIQRVIVHGYINVDIKNNNGGILTQTRANEFYTLDQDTTDYYTGSHRIDFDLTGEDIEAFFMSYIGLRNMNPSKSKTKLIKVLEDARQTFE